MSDEEMISNALNEYYKEQQTKDVRSIVSTIKSKRRLRGACISYNEYIAEMVDRSKYHHIL